MRAVWYDRTGPAREVLVVGERETPQPGPREALIRVHASGVNPSDAGMRRGPAPMAFPRITPNSDGAGVVEAVGPLAPKSLIGKRVWFYNGQRNGRAFGSAAEYIELDVDLIRPLPDAASFAEGATLGIPAMTAHVCLFRAGPVQGKTVLVTGGAGAVGHYAVQLAKWAGATVIATVSSPQKAARALAGGADHVVDYKREDMGARLTELAGREGVDHVVDVDFGGNLASVLPALKAGGSIAFYATRGEAAPPVPAGDLMRRNLAVFGMVLPTSAPERRRRAQDDITRWISTGQRMLSVAATFPLPDIALAHEAVERGDKVGTVVVEISNMLTRAAIQALCQAKPSAAAERPFGPEHVVYKIGGKMFAIVADIGDVRMTLKCDPVLSEIVRGEYAAISPGYHTDKRHWITIRQDEALPDAEVTRLIDHAYDQVRGKLTRAVQSALRAAEGGG